MLKHPLAIDQYLFYKTCVVRCVKLEQKHPNRNEF